MEKRRKHIIGLILGLLCLCLLTLGFKSCDSSVRLPSMGNGVHGVNGGGVDFNGEAKKVDDLINGIKTPITLESAAAIGAARAAYDALPDGAKAKVSLLDKLKGFEADLAALNAEPKEGTAAYLDNLLAGIKTPVTADQWDLLSKIRAGYNALPDGEKANFKGLDKLNGFELDLFNNPANLDSLLGGITLPAQAKDANLLAKIRAAFDRLSDGDKANFKGLDKLESLEADLFNTGAGLDNILNGIPTPITLDDADLISRIRTAYENLPEAEKANFKGLDKLNGFELDLSNLGLPSNNINPNALPVIDLINGIPTPITLDCEDAINKALDAYNALSDADKAGVSNYDLLKDYLSQLENLKNNGSGSGSDSETGIDVPSTGVE